MKKLLLLVVFICFSACCPFCENIDDDYFYEPRYEPVVLNRSEIDDLIYLTEPQEVITSSKIYIINDYIFVNDKLSGFHIFDNTDSSNPVKKKFLNFPGATDIAIRDNILYVNQATDLVTLSFNLDNSTITIEKRIENVFPELLSPDWDYPNNNEDEIVVNWKEK